MGPRWLRCTAVSGSNTSDIFPPLVKRKSRHPLLRVHSCLFLAPKVWSSRSLHFLTCPLLHFILSVLSIGCFRPHHNLWSFASFLSSSCTDGLVRMRGLVAQALIHGDDTWLPPFRRSTATTHGRHRIHCDREESVGASGSCGPKSPDCDWEARRRSRVKEWLRTA